MRQHALSESNFDLWMLLGSKPCHNIGRAEGIEATSCSYSSDSFFVYIRFPRSESYSNQNGGGNGTENSRDFQAISHHGKGRINKKDTRHAKIKAFKIRIN